MIKMCWFLLFVGLIVSSVYVFPSGYPQPTDYLLAMFILLVTGQALMRKERFLIGEVPRAWIALVLWIGFVCLGWALVHQSADFLKHAAFWTYNLLVSAAVIHVLRTGERSREIILWGVSGGLIVSGAGVLIDLGSSVRVTGFLNNPNQLAYYSLCGLSLLLLLQRFEPRLRPVQALALLGGVAGIFAAASLAAMAGFLSLLAAYMLANLKSIRRVGKTILATTVIVLLVVSVESLMGGHIAENVWARLDRLETKMDRVYEERKYDRMAAFPEYMILGAGEGHLERFYPHDQGEIHSSFGNLLFSYGIPGLFLFLGLIVVVARRAPIAVWLVLAALMVYSITHMGLRSTMFWLVLAAIWAEYGKGMVLSRGTVQGQFRAAPDASKQSVPGTRVGSE
jgi:hypothetical protein